MSQLFFSFLEHLAAGLPELMWWTAGFILAMSIFRIAYSPELSKGFQAIVTHFGRSTSNVPINELVLIAVNLPRPNKNRALMDLITLATLYGNKEMFFALRDRVPEKDLRRALLAKDNLGIWIHGTSDVGKENAEKLVFFALGTRTLIHLDAPIEEAERRVFEKYVTDNRNVKHKK